MSESCTVLYNGACPICAREIDVYRVAADRAAAPVAFRDVTDPATVDLLAHLGLSEDAAVRRFHVVRQGEVLGGIDGFVALWMDLPGWRWLGRLVGSRAVRPLAARIYDHLAAPLLYALHRRRQRRRDRKALAHRGMTP